jgi:hypothetical protein
MKTVTICLTQIGRQVRFFLSILSMVCLGAFSAQGQVVVDEGLSKPVPILIMPFLMGAFRAGFRPAYRRV